MVKSDLAIRIRSPRFVAGVVLLAALLFYGLQPFYARFVFVDRRPWADMLSRFPDRRDPTYVDLVKKSSETIPMGATVAVLYSTLDWNRGYSYAYFRAQYFLPGRKVVPLGWPTGAHPGRVTEADWLIVHGADPPGGPWTPVVDLPSGKLLRRQR